MFRKKVTALLMATIQIAVVSLGLAAMPMAALADTNACDTTHLSLSSGVNCAAPTETKGTDLFAQNGLFKKIADTLIFIVGAVAVIMLIIGGLRYVLSAGDSKNVTAAKDTILYAIVGIVVALLSFALINFVVGQLNPSAKPSATQNG
jgi:ABC-type Na+ efflux pump permease subunit